MPANSTVHVNPNNPLTRLNARQRLFATYVAEGKPAHVAAKMAGYCSNNTTGGGNNRLHDVVGMKEAVQYLQKRYANSIVASRKKVLEGFLEAIEQAKAMSDPAVQIAGWREIGKMCGYYAPEVKQVNVNVSSKRLVSELETLSDTQLLELIEKDEEALEGEATEVLEVPEVLTPEREQANVDDGISPSS